MARKKKSKTKMSEERRESLKIANRHSTKHYNEVIDDDGANAEFKDPVEKSASEQKLNTNFENLENVNHLDGYGIIKYDKLQQLIALSASCKDCGVGSLTLFEQMSTRRGWCSTIGLVCSNQMCEKNTNYNVVTTSPTVNGRAEVNLSAILALRSIGRGRASAEKMSTIMSLSAPLARHH